jgi:hypothetical protein
MIDWKILNYLNKQKYKRSLLIVKDIKQVEKFVISPQITVIEEKNFLEHFPENAYHIISTWEILSEGASVSIYTYLSKMNHLLRDDGQLYVRVLHNQSHLVEFDIPPFCWSLERIDSFAKAKSFNLYKEVEKIKTKTSSFLRFKYIPSF